MSRVGEAARSGRPGCAVGARRRGASLNGVLYFIYRDPMRSSNPFHWCPWIRDLSFLNGVVPEAAAGPEEAASELPLDWRYRYVQGSDVVVVVNVVVFVPVMVVVIVVVQGFSAKHEDPDTTPPTNRPCRPIKVSLPVVPPLVPVSKYLVYTLDRGATIRRLHKAGLEGHPDLKRRIASRTARLKESRLQRVTREEVAHIRSPARACRNCWLDWLAGPGPAIQTQRHETPPRDSGQARARGRARTQNEVLLGPHSIYPQPRRQTCIKLERSNITPMITWLKAQ